MSRASDTMSWGAQVACAGALNKRPEIRLLQQQHGGVYWITSPDADWLIVTSISEAAVRRKATAAIIAVSVWCGVKVRIKAPWQIAPPRSANEG